MSGNGNWTTEAVTGNLICAGGNAGETSRIIARISGPTTINFEMEIGGGAANDALVFYIDGVRQAATYGDPVTVQRAWTDSSSHLLMWNSLAAPARP
jgi:hypothetical protein